MGAAKWVILYLLLLAAFILLIRYLSGRRARRVRRTSRNQKIIPAEQFLADWIIDEKKQLGYKYDVFPGCYCLFIFEKPPRSGSYLGYDDIYIGQSVNVTRRVHGHLTGKGKGDVYADIKYGPSVSVELVPCEKEDMNEVEKALIAQFHSTDSYNDTKGGGQSRKKEHWWDW